MNQRTHLARSAGLTFTAAVALGGLRACKGTETAKSATTPNAMIIGPENIAVVKAEQIRSGPAISGTLQPEQQATVRAEVGGTVTQAVVEQGTRVNKGQLLARIDDAALRETELSARAAVTTAQSSVDLNKRQVERNETLLKAGAIAERDVEITRNQYSAAEAQLANANAQLANAMKQLSKSTIESPFSGIVSARTVSAGDVVQPGAALYTIVNPSSMRLEASVPANELASVRLGMPVDFVVNG